MAEQVCAKFTGNTSLVSRLDEFECEGQRSRSPVTKTRLALQSPLAAYKWYVLAANGLVGWGLTALLTQNRSYRAWRFVGIFYSKL